MHFCASLRAKWVPRRNRPAKHCSAKCAGICESLREGMKIPAAKAIKHTIHKLKNRVVWTPKFGWLADDFPWTQQTYARQFQGTIPFLKIQTQWPSVMAVKSLRCRGASIGKLRSIRTGETPGVPPLRFLASSKRDLITYNAAPWCFVSFFNHHGVLPTHVTHGVPSLSLL